jgi:hypothetical protein
MASFYSLLSAAHGIPDWFALSARLMMWAQGLMAFVKTRDRAMPLRRARNPPSVVHI